MRIEFNKIVQSTRRFLQACYYEPKYIRSLSSTNFSQYYTRQRKVAPIQAATNERYNDNVVLVATIETNAPFFHWFQQFDVFVDLRFHARDQSLLDLCYCVRIVFRAGLDQVPSLFLTFLHISIQSVLKLRHFLKTFLNYS